MTDGELRYCLDNPFDVGFFAIRRSEFQIAARLAANARHDVVSAVFLNRRAGERTLTLGLTFSSDQQEEVFAGIGEIEPNGFFLGDKRLEPHRLCLNKRRDN